MKKALRKSASKLTGDTENLIGDTSYLRGYVSGLSGDVTGLIGDVTGLSGDVDECGLTRVERVQGVRITDLILETPDTPVAKG